MRWLGFHSLSFLFALSQISYTHPPILQLHYLLLFFSYLSLSHFFSSYFTLESTQEILNEGRPLLCPFDTAMMDIMERFDNFLPTKVVPEEFSYTHHLWFDEFIKIWLESKNNSVIDEVCGLPCDGTCSFLKFFLIVSLYILCRLVLVFFLVLLRIL